MNLTVQIPDAFTDHSGDDLDQYRQGTAFDWYANRRRRVIR
jgi:hypothetical protein